MTSPIVQHWDARFLTGEPLSGQEEAWLALGLELYGLTHEDEETSQALWGRLRLALTDNGAPVKRRRRKPAPHPNERKAIEAAKQETRKRRLPPTVQVLPRSDPQARSRVAATHGDDRGWWVQLHEAFGTRSGGVVSIFMAELSRLAGETFGDDPDEAKLNAAIAIIHGAKPQNEIQAMLLAQMVAVHWLTMGTAGRALRSTYAPEQTGLVAKLAETFAKQSGALVRLQGKTGRQKITVRYERHSHQHRHVHVTPQGGGAEFENQVHEQDTSGCGKLREAGRRTLADDGRPALPRPDPEGVVVPMPREPGEAALQKTWRGKGLRSAKG